MTNRERFHHTMNFEPVDRLPMVEWAGWWNQTLERWWTEGLPTELTDAAEVRAHLGLDAYHQYWIGPRAGTFPAPSGHGKGVISNADEYRDLLKHLYPEDAFDRDKVQEWAERQATGEFVIWISLDGFFWFARTLLGIERHLYAFHDQPELLHMMNQDLLAFNLRVLDKFCALCTPDFMSFGEDMSYNNGPMISEDLFDEFMAPYYREIAPRLKERGVHPFVDTDGDIERLVPWFARAGVEGFLPLERQAGVDIVRLREAHPTLKIIGAYDKMVMNQGEERVRAEFERIFPVMREGGFIPSVDHQTPPGVSLEEYRTYLRLLREYCERAGANDSSLRV